MSLFWYSNLNLSGSFTASGGIGLTGTASCQTSASVNGAGSLTVSGVATCSFTAVIVHFYVEASGSLDFGGVASVYSLYIGGFGLSGFASVSFNISGRIIVRFSLGQKIYYGINRSSRITEIVSFYGSPFYRLANGLILPEDRLFEDDCIPGRILTDDIATSLIALERLSQITPIPSSPGGTYVVNRLYEGNCIQERILTKKILTSLTALEQLDQIMPVPPSTGGTYVVKVDKSCNNRLKHIYDEAQQKLAYLVSK